MSPIVLIAMLIVVTLIFVLPRKAIIIPFLLFVFLTPLEQNFNLGGLHVFAQRVVILCGCIRVVAGRLPSSGGTFPRWGNSIDKVFVWWAILRSLAFVLLYRETGAAVNQLGFLWDFVGGYFLVRHLILDEEDIRCAAKVMATIAAVMACCMLYEHLTGKNVFGLLTGGRVLADVRNGKIRARGVFRQQIIAGSFGGTLVPLFLWLWDDRKSRIFAVAGLISAGVIIVSASSSTGVSAFFIGVVALCFWPIRRHMRSVRWTIVAGVIGLAMVMKAPVWYLMARVDFTGGSTGWDRGFLVDQTVRHFWDWWLLGTKDNATWGYDTWDLCNQFVAEAIQGGLIPLILFITLVSRSFRRIGLARIVAEGTPSRERFLWVLGATLTAHLAAFFGISYFDQTRVWWFIFLAMVSAATAPLLGQVTKKEEASLKDPANVWLMPKEYARWGSAQT